MIYGALNAPKILKFENIEKSSKKGAFKAAFGRITFSASYSKRSSFITPMTILVCMDNSWKNIQPWNVSRWKYAALPLEIWVCPKEESPCAGLETRNFQWADSVTALCGLPRNRDTQSPQIWSPDQTLQMRRPWVAAGSQMQGFSHNWDKTFSEVFWEELGSYLNSRLPWFVIYKNGEISLFRRVQPHWLDLCVIQRKKPCLRYIWGLRYGRKVDDWNKGIRSHTILHGKNRPSNNRPHTNKEFNSNKIERSL